jgi:hypothetical protein
MKLLSSGYGKDLNFWAYARIDTLEDNEMLEKWLNQVLDG